MVELLYIEEVEGVAAEVVSMKLIGDAAQTDGVFGDVGDNGDVAAVGGEDRTGPTEGAPVAGTDGGDSMHGTERHGWLIDAPDRDVHMCRLGCKDDPGNKPCARGDGSGGSDDWGIGREV